MSNTATTEASGQKAVILFDGVCNLCNGAVQFVLERDPKGYFQFASLQSDAGRKLMLQHNIDPDKMSSMVLIENGKAYLRSTAALKIMRHFGGLWRLMYAFILVPAPIRHMVYDFIARNRYKWFGRTDSCWLPQPEWAGRFL